MAGTHVRQGVQVNTRIRSQEFPRELSRPHAVLPSSLQGTLIEYSHIGKFELLDIRLWQDGWIGPSLPAYL